MQGGVAAGAAVALGGPTLLTRRASAAANTAVIPVTSIPKYVTPLFILPAMPKAETRSGTNISVTARRFQQQVLPEGMPMTTVQGFGATNDPRTNRAPGYTLETTVNRLSRVTWINGLMDSRGNFLPQLFPVDPTIHWSNPPGGVDGRDTSPPFSSTPEPYRGPHTLIVHHHGAHDFQESDGYPEAWYLPNARDIPAGFARVGSFYDQFKEEARQRWGVSWPAGANISVYPNDQAAMTLWYHDHSLGTTRLGVHSGLAGLSFLRGGPFDINQSGVLPGPAPGVGADPHGRGFREIPLIFSTRTFNDDGSIAFPQSSHVTTGPYSPDSDVAPYWNQQAIGNTSVVNGNTWPFLEVEARRYRFRCLAADNQLPFGLRIVKNVGDADVATPIWVIGSDGGFVESPVNMGNDPLDMFTSERYDIIVDFAGLAGQELIMTNRFGVAGGTGEIMKFKVIPATSTDTTVPPEQLNLPFSGNVGNPTVTRKLFLERVPSTRSDLDPNNLFNVSHFTLGNINADGSRTRRDWQAPVTETPRLGTTEMWEFHNITPGGHAIHVHLIEFQAIDRQTRDPSQPPPPPLANYEKGRKDTIFVPQNSITRIKATYDRRVLMVWHCHFVDHEDHEMMRPMQVI